MALEKLRISSPGPKIGSSGEHRSNRLAAFFLVPRRARPEKRRARPARNKIKVKSHKLSCGCSTERRGGRDGWRLWGPRGVLESAFVAAAPPGGPPGRAQGSRGAGSPPSIL